MDSAFAVVRNSSLIVTISQSSTAITRVPSAGSNGFDIIVTRTLSLDGTLEKREEINTRYEATPEVVCTG